MYVYTPTPIIATASIPPQEFNKPCSYIFAYLQLKHAAIEFSVGLEFNPVCLVTWSVNQSPTGGKYY